MEVSIIEAASFDDSWASSRDREDSSPDTWLGDSSSPEILGDLSTVGFSSPDSPDGQLEAQTLKDAECDVSKSQATPGDGDTHPTSESGTHRAAVIGQGLQKLGPTVGASRVSHSTGTGRNGAASKIQLAKSILQNLGLGISARGKPQGAEEQAAVGPNKPGQVDTGTAEGMYGQVHRSTLNSTCAPEKVSDLALVPVANADAPLKEEGGRERRGQQDMSWRFGRALTCVAFVPRCRPMSCTVPSTASQVNDTWHVSGVDTGDELFSISADSVCDEAEAGLGVEQETTAECVVATAPLREQEDVHTGIQHVSMQREVSQAKEKRSKTVTALPVLGTEALPFAGDNFTRGIVLRRPITCAGSAALDDREQQMVSSATDTWQWQGHVAGGEKRQKQSRLAQPPRNLPRYRPLIPTQSTAESVEVVQCKSCILPFLRGPRSQSSGAYILRGPQSTEKAGSEEGKPPQLGRTRDEGYTRAGLQRSCFLPQSMSMLQDHAVQLQHQPVHGGDRSCVFPVQGIPQERGQWPWSDVLEWDEPEPGSPTTSDDSIASSDVSGSRLRQKEEGPEGEVG